MNPARLLGKRSARDFEESLGQSLIQKSLKRIKANSTECEPSHEVLTCGQISKALVDGTMNLDAAFRECCYRAVTEGGHTIKAIRFLTSAQNLANQDCKALYKRAKAQKDYVAQRKWNERGRALRILDEKWQQRSLVEKKAVADEIFYAEFIRNGVVFVQSMKTLKQRRGMMDNKELAKIVKASHLTFTRAVRSYRDSRLPKESNSMRVELPPAYTETCLSPIELRRERRRHRYTQRLPKQRQTRVASTLVYPEPVAAVVQPVSEPLASSPSPSPSSSPEPVPESQPIMNNIAEKVGNAAYTGMMYFFGVYVGSKVLRVVMVPIVQNLLEHASADRAAG